MTSVYIAGIQVTLLKIAKNISNIWKERKRYQLQQMSIIIDKMNYNNLVIQIGLV
jgi:hypothetical protein